MSTRNDHMKMLTGPRHQRGMISTIIALIVLVVTLMAAVALMRSVDTSNTIAGSLSFRQGVTQESERAYQATLANATMFTGSNGEADNTTIGYYASTLAVDSRGIPTLLTNQTGGLVMTGTQNIVRYVIERLCPNAGKALKTAPNACLAPSAAITGGSTTGNQGGFTAGALAAYRLTVRVDGPKNAVGYVQTVIR